MRQEILLCEINEYEKIFNRYSKYFAPGNLVFLRGELGSGKTTFVRFVCGKLEVSDLVSSPSFAIANVYHTSDFRIAHLDLYRLDTPAQLDDIGAQDFLDQNTLVFVEWPENCPGGFPPADLEIAFSFPDKEDGADTDSTYRCLCITVGD